MPEFSALLTFAVATLALLLKIVPPDHGSVAVQTLVLGGFSLLLAAISGSMFALLAHPGGQQFRGNRVFARRQKSLTGSVYVALGVGTATVGHS